MLNDKRKSPRRPIRYSAWVATKGEPLHGCVLTDVSETGCRIDIDDSKPIPDRFVLLLAMNASARRKCRVVWRKARQIGVKFERKLAASDRTTLVPKFDAGIDTPNAPIEPVEPAESDKAV